MGSIEREATRLFAAPHVSVERCADGSTIWRSTQALQPAARCVGDWLLQWAVAAPARPFLLERRGQSEWLGVTYGEALDRVRRIAAWLLRQRVGPRSPVAVLSENSIEHALLLLAAMHVGVPVVPISPSYSLISRDFGKLRMIIESVVPGVIYVADGTVFEPALNAVRGLHSGIIVVGRSDAAARHRIGAVDFSAIERTPHDPEVARAFAEVKADTVAKLLFTSGSTGTPKGVINTQRMLCVNQQQLAQIWPFTRDAPPVIVDWLPWSHTFGGNHNFNLVLCSGGTLHIDRGRPLAGEFEATAQALREISPTIYFNVPRGYDMLLAELRTDSALRTRFFSRLQVIFYAAAALPQPLWDALESMSQEQTGRRIPIVCSWGATETAPLATSCHYRAERAGVIGIPVPGCELKLVPSGSKLEARVRGPQVMPGYWKREPDDPSCFDHEGFYRIGDAVRPVDPDQPALGLYFDGRIAEDFKLTSGTWVDVGRLRLKALSALSPIAQDVVVTGHDRDEVGLLIFPNVSACRNMCGDLEPEAPLEDVLCHSVIASRVREGLRELKAAGSGSSTFPARALLLDTPPAIDAGEITDKGYINQRAVLERRRALVDHLYLGARLVHPLVFLIGEPSFGLPSL